MEDPQPDEEDIFISDTGNLGSITIATWCHKIIARDSERMQVERKVKAWMEEQEYWPNVWFVSDHGNAHLITNLGE